MSAQYLKKDLLLSVRAVEEYLGQKNTVKWIKAKELLNKVADSCVDGRETNHVLSSPGGDVAILTEAIIALGKVINRHLTTLEIDAVFAWRLANMGSFYMHTDEHALHHLQKALSADKNINKKFSSLKQVYQYIINPPKDKQLSLMIHLFEPINMGCGHLKQMFLSPEAYGMSRKVMQKIMISFFNTLWNGSAADKKKIIYRLLTGEHQEGAVIIAKVNGNVSDNTMIPMIRPTDGKTSVFVFHPQVTEYLHHTYAQKLVKSGIFAELKSSKTADYQETMGKVMGEGVRETVSRLAFALPIYSFELSR